MQQTIIQRSPNGKDKLWSGEYIFLLGINLLLAISFYMIAPVLPKYATQLGASLSLAGVIAGLFSITALVARPFGGLLADRINKKRILFVATTLLFFSAFGYSFSPTIPLLVGFRILHGIGFSISSTAVVALAIFFIPKDRLGEGVGYFGLGQILSSAVGPNIGIWVGQKYGYPITFGLSGVVLLVTALLITFLRQGPPRDAFQAATNGKKKFKIGDLIAVELLPLAIMGGVFSMTNGLVSSFLVLIGDARHIANIGLYFSINALCLLFVRPIAGKLSDKKGLALILIPALILTALESLLLANASVLWVFLVAGACKAFGQGSAQPALQSACIKKLGPERSGVATSTFYIGGDIGQGMGPIIGGAVAGAFGYQTMFYSSAAVLGVVFLAFGLFKLISHNKLELRNAN
jgi:MFS family permease